MLKKRQFGEIITDCVEVVHILIESRQAEPLGCCGSDCKARTPAMALKNAVEALEVLEKVCPSACYCHLWSCIMFLSRYISSDRLFAHDDMESASFCDEDWQLKPEPIILPWTVVSGNVGSGSWQQSQP